MMLASRIPFIRALIALLVLAFALPATAQLAIPRAASDNHIAAELVAEKQAAPGEELMLALLFSPEPGWHGYWSNPGDAGYGMTLDWNLPDGWEAGEPLYPVPRRLLISGLMNHVFEGDYAVLVPVEIPAGAALSASVPVSVRAGWLACTDKICVPEEGTLTLQVPTAGAGAAPAERDMRFDEWRAKVPPMLDRKASFALSAETVRLAIPLPASLDLVEPHVFVGTEQLVDYAGEQRFYRNGDVLVAELVRRGLAENVGQVEGILKLDAAGNGIRFAANAGDVPAGGTLVAGAGLAKASLWLLLGGAFLGGLLLNLMPCVFPILSLKAMTLARSGESEPTARREGLAYTAGVVLACVGLGGLLLLLRAGGSEIGWAFQLQEPGVVAALLVLAVAITANFAGVYSLPSLSITRAGGRSGAFATGLLAAFVATPCTGPFMAAALGAALLLPPAQALLLFGMLGLGLALPFLLLGFVPALRGFLPRPGAWMETFRRILAIPMGLTALALLWLAWRLGGAWFAAVALIAAAVVVAILAAITFFQMRARPVNKAYVAAGFIALAVCVPVLSEVYEPPAQGGDSILAVQDFDEARLADARASGRPVFLWFTADWCLTCKVNESVAIEREATRAAFEKADVVAMRGDWTRSSPQITNFLTEHGAAGVPLYLWYPPGGGEGEILPQVLMPGSLVELAEASRKDAR